MPADLRQLPAARRPDEAPQEPTDAQLVLRKRSGLMKHFLDTDAPPIEWVVEGLIPAGVEGGIVAAGGTGKGLLEMMIAICTALGIDCGPFPVPRPRGVMILALEDDIDELHRRAKAALAVLVPDPTDEERDQLANRIEFKPLRGVKGASLRDDFVDDAIAAAKEVPEVGLIFLDPLTRGLALPEGKDLNSQEGAGITISQLGRMSKETGATVIYAHHVNKASQRDGTELLATAATGSKQLVDLSRVVMNLKELLPSAAEAYGLDPEPDRRYIELKVSKTNGPRPTGGPFVFEVLPSGAVEWRPEAQGLELTNQERVFDVIRRLHLQHGRPVTRQEILAARGGLGENAASEAWLQLEEAAVIERRRGAVEEPDPQTGKTHRRDGFVPAKEGEEHLAQLLGREDAAL